MQHIKLEPLDKLDDDFIRVAILQLDCERHCTNNNEDKFKFDVIKTIVNNANDQHEDRYIYKLTIYKEESLQYKPFPPREFILINMPFNIKIDDGLFLYKSNEMFNKIEDKITLNRTYVFTHTGKIYKPVFAEKYNVNDAINRINCVIKSEFKYLYQLFHDGKLEF